MKDHNEPTMKVLTRKDEDRALRKHRQDARKVGLRVHTWGGDKFNLRELCGVCMDGGASTWRPIGAKDGKPPPLEFTIGDHQGFADWLNTPTGRKVSKRAMKAYDKGQRDFQQFIAEQRRRAAPASKAKTPPG